MPKAPKHGYYAVPNGRAPGVYTSWVDCEAQIKGFPGAIYKKLNTEAEAIEFMNAKSNAAHTSASRHITSVPVVLLGASKVRTTTVEAALDEMDCDVVYCDGACKGNGQAGSVAGVGVWWGHGDPRNISERCPGAQTNNRAELIAIVRILETTPPLKRRLLIKTDSNYSIQCVTSWIFNWTKNGFLAADGKPVKNRALIKYLAALLRVRRKTSQTVEFKHVRGHVGIEGNEAADQLANLGATKSAVPERDWERLEQQVLQSPKPVKSTKEADDVLQAYADGLLSDDEPAELFDTSVEHVTARESRQDPRNGNQATQSHTPASPVPRNASPTRANDISITPSSGDTRSESRFPSGPSLRPAAVTAQARPSVAHKKHVKTISKEELEAYASCLLGDDELSTLGKNGVFDSDF